MYAFWMNGHNEHGAGSSAVVGIDTGPTPDETIFDDDATSRVLRDATIPT